MFNFTDYNLILISQNLYKWFIEIKINCLQFKSKNKPNRIKKTP